jgi:hypothetical protein
VTQRLRRALRTILRPPGPQSGWRYSGALRDREEWKVQDCFAACFSGNSAEGYRVNFGAARYTAEGIASGCAVICPQSVASTFQLLTKGVHFSESVEPRSQPEHSTHQERAMGMERIASCLMHPSGTRIARTN